MPARVFHVYGNIAAQLDVDAIVNAWNCNILPWWLLMPQGVSKAIRQAAGAAPFLQLRRHGRMPLGKAVLTGPGKLPIKAIIHVAGIGLTWTASEESIRLSIRNALALASEHGFTSIATPIIGSGTGGIPPDRALAIMQKEITGSPFAGDVRIVRYQRG